MLTKKYLESIEHMTNKVGGMGKDVKHKHKEPKPLNRHNYCFLCKDEFKEYFSHIESEFFLLHD